MYNQSKSWYIRIWYIKFDLDINLVGNCFKSLLVLAYLMCWRHSYTCKRSAKADDTCYWSSLFWCNVCLVVGHWALCKGMMSCLVSPMCVYGMDHVSVWLENWCFIGNNNRSAPAICMNLLETFSTAVTWLSTVPATATNCMYTVLGNKCWHVQCNHFTLLILLTLMLYKFFYDHLKDSLSNCFLKFELSHYFELFSGQNISLQYSFK